MEPFDNCFTAFVIDIPHLNLKSNHSSWKINLEMALLSIIPTAPKSYDFLYYSH